MTEKAAPKMSEVNRCRCFGMDSVALKAAPPLRKQHRIQATMCPNNNGVPSAASGTLVLLGQGGGEAVRK